MQCLAVCLTTNMYVNKTENIQGPHIGTEEDDILMQCIMTYICIRDIHMHSWRHTYAFMAYMHMRSWYTYICIMTKVISPKQNMLKAWLPAPSADNMVYVCGPPPMMISVSGNKKSPADQGMCVPCHANEYRDVIITATHCNRLQHITTHYNLL